MHAAGLEAGALGEPAEDEERAGARQRAAACVEEEVGAMTAVEVGASEREVAAQRLGGRPAERDEAFLAALADDAHHAGLEVDRAARQAERLGDAEAGAVEELHQGAVAHRARRRADRGVDEALGLCGREGARHRPRPAGTGDAGGGVVVARADERLMPEVCAHRGESAGDRRGRAAVRRASSRATPRSPPSSRRRRGRRATRRTLRDRGGTRPRSSASGGPRGAAGSSRRRDRGDRSSRRTRFGGVPRPPAARLRPRVRVVVDPAQAAGVDVAVDLGRRERGVAEELLDRPQVGATLEQVRRVGVAESVRVREEPAEDAGVEPPAADGDEQRVAGASYERRPARHGATARSRQAASSPSGTSRSFPPFPRTWTCSRSRSTSARSSPTASAERRPQE